MDPDAALVNALPDLRAHERALRAKATAMGIAYKIAPYGALRTQADTSQILKYRDDDYRLYVQRTRAAGKIPVDIGTFRPIAPFGNSYHNYGAAFDVVVTSAPQGVSAAAALAKLGAVASSVGLRWGGYFAKPDTPHFELPIGLTQARERWNAHQNPKPNDDGGSLASILAIGIPGASVIGQSFPMPTAATVATIQRHPLATATITTGAVVALALLTWIVVKRATE